MIASNRSKGVRLLGVLFITAIAVAAYLLQADPLSTVVVADAGGEVEPEAGVDPAPLECLVESAVHVERTPASITREETKESAPATPEASHRAQRLEQLERVHLAYVESNDFHNGYALALTAVLVDMDSRGEYRDTGGLGIEVRTRSLNGSVEVINGRRHYRIDPALYPAYAEMKSAMEGELAGDPTRRSKLRLTEAQQAELDFMYARATEQLAAGR